jgi:hypothetical protein
MSKRGTIDGGPPSDEPIEAGLMFFPPDAPLASLDAAEQHRRIKAVALTEKACITGERLLCSGCDTCFDAQQAPALLFYVRPWCVRGPKTASVVGGFCSACAAKPQAQLRGEYLAAWNARGSMPPLRVPS